MKMVSRHNGEREAGLEMKRLGSKDSLQSRHLDGKYFYRNISHLLNNIKLWQIEGFLK